MSPSPGRFAADLSPTGCLDRRHRGERWCKPHRLAWAVLPGAPNDDRMTMARVSYIDEKDHPELADLTARIRGARRGNLINIYRLLLHSPALAESWFVNNNAVRWKTELDGRLREIVIIRIAQMTGATYVEKQHVPELALAEGVTLAECEALSDWRNAASFSERERAALAYAET